MSSIGHTVQAAQGRRGSAVSASVWQRVGEMHEQISKDLRSSKHLTAVSFGAEGVSVYAGLDTSARKLVDESSALLEARVDSAP